MDESALIGRQMGRYRLEALLKRDAFGLVFRAADQFGSEAVAARIITPNPGDGSWFAERLLRELRPVTHLDHAALLPYREVGAQGELVYLIGPLLPATTLANRLGRPLPPSEAIALLRPVAGALDYLHEQRIVHRSVNPAMLLLRDDKTALLSEAGLAEALAEAALSGMVSATPRPEDVPYLAPEQLLGSLLDGRADLYALGAVLYEALTGQPPSPDGDSASIPAPREVNANLSPALEAVVLRILARAPYERFATGAALFAALDEALSVGSETAPAPPLVVDADDSPGAEQAVTTPPVPQIRILPARTPAGLLPGGHTRATATLERPKIAAPSVLPAAAAPAPLRWRDPEAEALSQLGSTPPEPGIIDRAMHWWKDLTFRGRLYLIIALLGICAIGVSQVYSKLTPGHDLRQGRYDHAALLLPDGQVLIVGGSGGDSSGSRQAELYDPIARRSATIPSPQWGYTNGTVTLLADGRVVLTGISSVERYDPRTRTWQSLAGPPNVRFYASSAILPDGRILMTGGLQLTDSVNSSNRADLYEPATNTWRAVAPMLIARTNHTATVLPDGRILVAGGTDQATKQTLDSAEIYDPATNTWHATSAMTGRQAVHTATLLPDGRVLLAGGVSAPLTARYSAQIYDPATDRWRTAGTHSAQHLYSTATILSDGRVLLVGGQTTNGAAVGSVEVYDPGLNNWSLLTMLATSRVNHTATLLADGRVLVAGGQQYRDKALKSVEIIDPR